MLHAIRTNLGSSPPVQGPPSPEGRGGQGVRTPEGRGGQGARFAFELPDGKGALRDLTPSQQYGYLWNSMQYPYQGRPEGKVRAFFAGGNGGQISMAIPDLDLVIAFTGGNYSDAATFRTQRTFMPEFLLPAVTGPLVTNVVVPVAIGVNIAGAPGTAGTRLAFADAMPLITRICAVALVLVTLTAPVVSNVTL